MAQGAIAGLPSSIGFDKAQALHEIEELAKIVRFRDEVLGGRHSIFKVSPKITVGARKQSSPKSIQQNSPYTNPAISTNYTNVAQNGSDFGSLFDSRSVEKARISAGSQSLSANELANGEKSAINPILLGKSENLIKAEVQLKRQHLERGLRDQAEQQRLAQKAAMHAAESLPDFDLSDVLFKALNLVHPSTAAEIEPSVGARSASDSFDEKTFYSSQHDSIKSVSPPAARKEIGAFHSAISTDRPNIDSYGRDLDVRQQISIAGAPESRNLDSDLQDVTSETPSKLPLSSFTQSSFNAAASVHGLPPAQYGKDFVDITQGDSEIDQASGSQSQQEQASGVSRLATAAVVDRNAVQSTNDELMEDAFPPSPRIFAHDLSPFEPEPARVSPVVAIEPNFSSHQSTVAGESSLAHDSVHRALATIASSPDSSPKGNDVRGKKKKKDKQERKEKRSAKKRKSTGKTSAVETPDTPYIKPEPRSPSPFTAAPLIRPAKRQRQSMHQSEGQGQGGLNYDEPSHDDQQFQKSSGYQARYQQPRPNASRFRDIHEPSDSESTAYRRPQLREEPQHRRVVSYEPHHTPQPMYATEAPRYEPRLNHASPVVMLDSPLEMAPRYYREDALPPRQIVRPLADRERSRSPIMHERVRPSLTMAPPPRATPRRIVVDDYGRQFYAPEPAPTRIVSRASVAPSYSEHQNEDIVYERPMRAITRQVAETWEEDVAVYRRASPLPQQARRVVTQPEYDPELRQYRQRDVSARPSMMVPPGEEYARPIEPVVRRQMSHFEAPPQLSYRAVSARPEAVRYEASREYGGRMTSIHPDAASREYAPPGTVTSHPGSRLGSVAPQPSRIREYSVRPEGYEHASREYAPQQHTTDGGYGSQPRRVIRRVVQQSGEGEYYERLPPQQQVVYEPPREVIYR